MHMGDCERCLPPAAFRMLYTSTNSWCVPEPTSHGQQSSNDLNGGYNVGGDAHEQQPALDAEHSIQIRFARLCCTAAQDCQRCCPPIANNSITPAVPRGVAPRNCRLVRSAHLLSSR